MTPLSKDAKDTFGELFEEAALRRPKGGDSALFVIGYMLRAINLPMARQRAIIDELAKQQATEKKPR